MKITGELLKSERTQKNLTVQDVAFALKLSAKIITAIEAGQVENLPAKTFIRGFVKSYAHYLKIDVDQVMRQFQEEMGTTHPLPKNPPPPPPAHAGDSIGRSQTNKEEKKPKTHEQAPVLNETKSSRSFIYIGLAVVLVILIVATNRIVDRYQKESIVDPNAVSKVEPLNPNQTQAPQAVAAPGFSANSTQPVQEVSPAVTESNAPIEMAQHTEAKNVLPAVPTTTPKTIVDTNPEDGFEPSNEKPIEVIIEAKKDVEIMYARGNTRAFSKIKLSSKQIQVIRSPSGLYLKSDDGGSFHLVVNGIQKGQAGANNKPVKLSF
jgi:cytoskeleton protein RodZ